MRKAAYGRLDHLLIEPFWNRNHNWTTYQACYCYPFNRTSLESKLGPVGAVSWLAQPFNRTSLESKLGYTCGGLSSSPLLLIEPVWNRNSLRHRGKASERTLLIEPVWNRNAVMPVFFDKVNTF